MAAAPDVPDELLRPALELAFATVVLGSRSRTPVPPPPALRPFLHFQKLPARALPAVRRVVDGDDGFRERLGAAVDAEVLGRPSWLYLRRPEGWEEELAGLAAEEAGRRESVEKEREERNARKRLAAAEEAAGRAAAELAAARVELDARDRRIEELLAGAGELRRRLEQADERGRALERRLRAAERSAEEAARRAEETARRAEETARRAEERAAELVTRRAEASPAAGAAAVPADEHVAPVPPVERAGFDRPALVAALAAATRATTALATALDAAGRAIAVEGDRPEVRAPSAAPPALDARRRRPDRRRTPLRVARGLPADSAAAAEAWLRVPGLVLVVDGYNVAKEGWPAEPLPVQRERLLDVLEELEARHGTRIEVVFDGADVPDVVPTGRRRVRVSFSPPAVPADDVIVRLVADLDPDVPVAVATNDGAVRTAVARRHGANLIGSRQLLQVARR